MAEFNPHPKQAYALLKLWDKKTREIGYGGAAGGGKSYLGCFWLIYQCLNYPGVSYALCRRELTNLKKTTLISFFEVCKDLDICRDVDYKINFQTNIIEFSNGSMIFMLDTSYQPGDPLYTRFGGLLLTGAFVDESNETPAKAIEILKTRLGRCKTAEYSILPKLLETFNPSKDHIYSRYYKPWKENTMPEDRCFIKAVVYDNPSLDPNYIKQLEAGDEITRQRMLLGNFDYDDDDRALVGFSQIQDVFTNTFVDTGERWLVADLAMQGRDNFVLSLWDGLRCRFLLVKNKSSGLEIEQDLRNAMEEYKIPRSRVIYDSDGMGNYLESYLRGVQPFRGGASPINKKEYQNLKAECAFKLSELIQKGELYVDCDEETKNILLEELGQLKRDHIDKDDRKKSLIKKEEMKKNIGRSPDFLDVLIMRMMPEVRPKRTLSFSYSG